MRKFEKEGKYKDNYTYNQKEVGISGTHKEERGFEKYNSPRQEGQREIELAT